MAEAGITVNLVNTTNIVQEFFTDGKVPSALIPLRRAGLDKITRNLAPGSIGDTCGYDDPKLNAFIAKLKALGASTTEYQQTWWAMDEYIVKNALHLFLIWSPTVNAYNPETVTKVVYAPDVLGFRVRHVQDDRQVVDGAVPTECERCVETDPRPLVRCCGTPR